MIVNKTHTIPIECAKEIGISSIPSLSDDLFPHIFHITHDTHYRYTSKILFSKHLFRLQPVTDMSQFLLNYQCTISVNQADVCHFVGAFGNYATFIEIKEPYFELHIVSESVIATQEVPKRADLLHQPRTMPLIWMPWDRIMMQAYLQPPELPESELFDLAEYAMSFVKKNNNDVFAVLNDINQTIYQEYTYIPGVTSLFTTPYQIYRSRKGVCQDFTNLFICLARLLDIPARYRVGYLYTETDYENKIQGDATHAWAEIYFPYLGWLGFDPTNGCLAGKNHIKVACGRYFNDATPTSGTIFESESEVEETLSTNVQVRALK